MSSNVTKFLSIGLIIVFLTGVGWYTITYPQREFQKEVNYYLLLYNKNPSVVYFRNRDGFLDNILQNYTLFPTQYLRMEKQELRTYVLKEIEEAKYYKVQIYVDRKARAIIIVSVIPFYWTNK